MTDPLDELDVDVRSVSVVWAGDEPYPDVSFTGCSAFEALGFLLVAADWMRNTYALPLDDDDD